MSTEQQAATQQEESNGWRPSAGDRIVGKIVDIAFTDMGYGEYPILTVETDSGAEVAVHGFHTVLKSEIFAHEPQPGEPVDITYLGKKDGGGYGKGYDNYRVRWQSGGQVNWGSRKGQPQQERSVDPPIEPSPVPQAAEQPAAPPAGSQFGDEPPF